MVTKLAPFCKVKLLENNGAKAVVRSPEKAGGGGSTPSLAAIISNDLGVFAHILRPKIQPNDGNGQVET
jgi:hypothetical protein